MKNKCRNVIAAVFFLQTGSAHAVQVVDACRLNVADHYPVLIYMDCSYLTNCWSYPEDTQLRYKKNAKVWSEVSEIYYIDKKLGRATTQHFTYADEEPRRAVWVWWFEQNKHVDSVVRLVTDGGKASQKITIHQQCTKIPADVIEQLTLYYPKG